MATHKRARNPMDARIRALQVRLGLEPDGVIGPVTLTRIEALLPRIRPPRPRRARKGRGHAAGVAFGVSPAPVTALAVSRRGLDELVAFEVTSEAAYTRRYARPIWPGGESGVTIGIGYDVGTQSAATIRADWTGRLPDEQVERLAGVSGVVGSRARSVLDRVRDVLVRFPVAEEVFYLCTLPRYARLTRQAFPGIESLPPDVQAMLLSLVYNRGAGMSGERRREMREIRDCVAQKDVGGIARALRSMTRLWDPKVLPGLVARREREAAIVESAKPECPPEQLVRL